jgi:hypothetical protein
MQSTIRLTPLPRTWNKDLALNGKLSRFRSSARLIPLPQEEDRETVKLPE